MPTQRFLLKDPNGEPESVTQQELLQRGKAGDLSPTIIILESETGEEKIAARYGKWSAKYNDGADSGWHKIKNLLEDETLVDSVTQLVWRLTEKATCPPFDNPAEIIERIQQAEARLLELNKAKRPPSQANLQADKFPPRVPAPTAASDSPSRESVSEESEQNSEADAEPASESPEVQAGPYDRQEDEEFEEVMEEVVESEGKAEPPSGQPEAISQPQEAKAPPARPVPVPVLQCDAPQDAAENESTPAKPEDEFPADIISEPSTAGRSRLRNTLPLALLLVLVVVAASLASTVLHYSWQQQNNARLEKLGQQLTKLSADFSKTSSSAGNAALAEAKEQLAGASSAQAEELKQQVSGVAESVEGVNKKIAATQTNLNAEQQAAEQRQTAHIDAKTSELSKSVSNQVSALSAASNSALGSLKTAQDQQAALLAQQAKETAALAGRLDRMLLTLGMPPDHELPSVLILLDGGQEMAEHQNSAVVRALAQTWSAAVRQTERREMGVLRTRSSENRLLLPLQTHFQSDIGEALKMLASAESATAGEDAQWLPAIAAGLERIATRPGSQRKLVFITCRPKLERAASPQQWADLTDSLKKHQTELIVIQLVRGLETPAAELSSAATASGGYLLALEADSKQLESSTGVQARIFALLCQAFDLPPPRKPAAN